MNGLCAIQLKKNEGKGINSVKKITEYPIEFDSSNGDYYVSFNHKRYYSLKPEDFNLQKNEWLFVSFTNPDHRELTTNKLLNLPIKYEDGVVKVL